MQLGRMGVCFLTKTAGIQGPHVENVNALHLAHDLQTLETRGLLEVGRNGAGLRALGDEVRLAGYVCIAPC